LANEVGSVALKPIFASFISLASVIIGALTFYEVLTVWVPTEGWTADNLVSIGFAFFMIAGGGMEIFRRVVVMLPKGEDSKRCTVCGAMVPSVARFCRECGTHFSATKN
jgi:hypothetical protein